MKKYIFTAISLIFVLAINTYFRSFPVNFSQFKIQAKDIAQERTAKQIMLNIEKRLPDYSASVKEKIFRSVLKDYRRKNKAALDKEIEDEYKKLKSRYQDSAGQTYLMELDCWNWARYVENVLLLGRPGDKVINGWQIDALMLSPDGVNLMWNHLLYYLSAYLYKIFYLFKPIALFNFLFYLPLFYAGIFIIVLYFFCWRYFGNLCAIVACLFVGLSRLLLQRSCAGWFDTDILQLLFPLIIIWAYLLSYKTDFQLAAFFWLFISSLFIGLFSVTWTGWWFIFLVIIAYELYSLLNLVNLRWQYKEDNLAIFARHAFSLLLFIIVSLSWVIVITGPAPLENFYSSVKVVLSLNKAVSISIWPNVYYTVAEIKKPDMLSITSTLWGMPFFVFSLGSMLFLFLFSLRNTRISSFKREAIVILVLWFLSMFFACSKGTRFAMFLAIPLGISLGWCINEFFDFFTKRNNKLMVLAIILITALLCSKLVNKANITVQGLLPLMDDSWYKVLTQIKQSTPKSAIINSWWDYGDFFKVVSRRRVIFDGQSQNIPQAYWMANVLLSRNEAEALRILRMLNNGGNKAYDLMSPYFKDSFKQILLLKKALRLDRQDAYKLLAKHLPDKVVNEIISILFDTPKDKAYFVVDSSMKWKITAISYLGNWDFNKVYLAQVLGKKKQGQIVKYLVDLGVEKNKAKKLYRDALINQTSDSWVSSRLRFHTDLVKGQKRSDGLVLFDNGYVYNPKERNIYLYSCRNTRFKIPQSLFLLNQTKLEEIKYEKPDINWSALVMGNASEAKDYTAILLDHDLGQSLFTRLYFLNGQGLKHFKPVIEEKDGDDYIRVFEIAWE